MLRGIEKMAKDGRYKKSYMDVCNGRSRTIHDHRYELVGLKNVVDVNQHPTEAFQTFDRVLNRARQVLRCSF